MTVLALDVVLETGGWAGGAEGGLAPVPPGTWEALAQRAAEAAIAAAPDVPVGPLTATLLLTDDETLRSLNRQWRGKDVATNVLSFPSTSPSPPGEPRHLGDVALAYETLVREAGEEGKRPHEHAAHLVIHGLLHLLGQDHLEEADAAAMEAVEVAALARLGIADPYGDRELA